MDLVLLSGPPAVGKLTVAREISRLTGMPVFHDHVTRDLVRDLFADSLDADHPLVDALRRSVLSYCARRGRSLVFTFVHGGPDDDAMVDGMVRSVEDEGGRVRFVELTAPTTVLLERVGAASRRRHGKLVDAGVLAGLLQAPGFGGIPRPDSLRIDTSETDPVEAARTVVDHWALDGDPGVRLAPATGADGDVLAVALLAAVNWNGEQRQRLDEMPGSVYLAGWPRPGDDGVVARTADGEPVGAAWVRRFREAEGSYGWVADDVPELTLGLAPGFRGRGTGTRLLTALLDRARAGGVRAVSLSVEDGNPARRLYERSGFRKVGRNGGSDTLLLDLARPRTASSPDA